MDKPTPNDHPIHELIAKRWSPRAFADKSVEPGTLASLFEAARWGASSFNEQPWRFLVATRDDAEAFGRALDCLVPFNQTWARHAPVLAFSVALLHFSHNGKPNRHAWYDTGNAVAMLSIEATARGLVLHQMGGIDGDKIRATYEIPEAFEPIAGIAIGYPGDPASLPQSLAETETAPRERRPNSESVFSGRWGEPPAWS